ncbi:YbhB/YbcL family Raf kinase inhibitor-like protein [Ilyomonas limi]|uniref:YbhB/YbcL family Raf kinase inhibitor-like protein n=1 Tax=Ilyomonas limi TaxID=2575867 RepID=A0A4U3KQI2_9BACT|nr:YbhB/YbcL family Raf kinase inhibitor-like protein [Ilyomonas limi]TKK64411.1 YbhB/YbcL family Raf kinase inhibitor-like protein [Ilyomonas limi]
MPALTEVKLSVSSPAFKHGEEIPQKYSCEGENINPPLNIEGLPEDTKSLSIIVEDPDAPNGTFIHWVCFNIDPIKHIAENHQPGMSGHNSAGKTGYRGPCPPSGSHRYFFKVYALNTKPDVQEGIQAEPLKEAMQRHTIGFGELMGRYEKKGNNAGNR